MRLILVLLAVTAYAAASGTDQSPTAGIGSEPGGRAVLPILSSFNIETFSTNVYNVGLGWFGGNVWITDGVMQGGGAGPNKIYVITGTPPHTLVTSYDQYGTIGWGLRDLTSNGTYIFGSDDTVVDYYNPATGAWAGWYSCAACNPNRAQAWDGTYFYTGSFSNTVYRVTWNGVSGSAATYTTWSTAIANNGTYGAAWDADWPCMWVSTGSADGMLYQLNTSGALITTYSISPEAATAGGCEMGSFGGMNQLWVLAQATPDMAYCFNVRSLALDRGTWGEIKTLF